MKKYKHKKIGESGYRAKYYLSKNGTLSTEHLYREWKFANGMREEVCCRDAPNPRIYNSCPFTTKLHFLSQNYQALKTFSKIDQKVYKLLRLVCPPPSPL